MHLSTLRSYVEAVEDRARDDYGVVFTKSGDVDQGKSAELRDRLRKQTTKFKVYPTDKSPYQGIKGRHRRVHLNPDDAKKYQLADGDLVELLGKHLTPLRTWVSLDAGVPAGQIPLDAFGQKVIDIVSGDRASLRS